MAGVQRATRRCTVAETDSLDRLSSAELHDLAIRHALRQLDVAFFWRLLEYLPVAEAAAGRLDEAEADIQTLRAHVDDITDSGEGDIAELLRPFYLDYLRRQEDAEPSAGSSQSFRRESPTYALDVGDDAPLRLNLERLALERMISRLALLGLLAFGAVVLVVLLFIVVL